MGQKINSNIFRLGYRHNKGNTFYQENSLNSLSDYIFEETNVKKFILNIFNKHGLVASNFFFFRSEQVLFVFLSFYVSIKIRVKVSNLLKAKKIFFKPSILNLLSNKSKKNRIWLLKFLKTKQKFNDKLLNFYFTEKILCVLYNFTRRKVSICLFLNNISIKNLHKLDFNLLKKTSLQMRKFARASFYKDSFNTMITAFFSLGTASLFSNLIAHHIKYLKRHNYYFNFLKRSLNLFLKLPGKLITGLKIIITGRLNGKPRSSSKTIQLGKTSLQSMDSKIVFNSTTSYSNYGTFGIKVWVCEKKVYSLDGRALDF